MRAPRRLTAAAIVAVLSFGVAACGGDDDDVLTGGEGLTQTEETPAPAETTETTADDAGGDGGDPVRAADFEVGNAENLSEKPGIKIPEGKGPPEQLLKRDLVEGDGATAREGSELSMQYVGVAFSSGEEFDASWGRGEPFAFTLGGGDVIQGWDEGIEGMKVGGRRLLVIPPDKGYGEQGAGGAIGPNETLVFVVDLKEA
jgi:peptidylprolyl isomerase